MDKFFSDRQRVNQIINAIFNTCHVNLTSSSWFDSLTAQPDSIRDLQTSFANKYFSLHVSRMLHLARLCDPLATLERMLTPKGIQIIEATEIKLIWPNGFSNNPFDLQVFFPKYEKPEKSMFDLLSKNRIKQKTGSVTVSSDTDTFTNLTETFAPIKRNSALLAKDYQNVQQGLALKIGQECTISSVCCGISSKESNSHIFNYKDAAQALLIVMIKRLNDFDDNYFNNLWTSLEKAYECSIPMTDEDFSDIVFRSQLERDVKKRRLAACNHALDVIKKAFSLEPSKYEKQPEYANGTKQANDNFLPGILKSIREEIKNLRDAFFS